MLKLVAPMQSNYYGRVTMVEPLLFRGFFTETLYLLLVGDKAW